MKIAVDWDDTLVDVHTQEWLPGALEWLRTQLLCGSDVFVHTCRANWPEGRASVEAKLASARVNIRVEAKPSADRYIDDKAEKPQWAVGPNQAEQIRTIGNYWGSATTASLPRKVNGIVVY